MRENEFIRGPKWRTQTAPARRATGVVVTVALVVGVGAGLLAGVMWLLARFGAPDWVATLPWWGPTVGVIVWTLARPQPAVATDDDDESWAGYAIRYVLVGPDEPRPAAVRVIIAVILGAPIAWALALAGALMLVGIV